LAGVLDLGRAAVFGLVLLAGLLLAAGLGLAFGDGDLVRLTVPALDLVFALLLVFAAALAFAGFLFFLATMRAPSASNDGQPYRVATPTQPFAASLSFYLKSYKPKNALSAVTNVLRMCSS
jgi:hypothetical protein